MELQKDICEPDSFSPTGKKNYGSPLKRIIVVLRNNLDNTRAAAFMTLQAKTEETLKTYGPVEVINAADVDYALKLWQESSFYPVAGFFINPDDPKYGLFESIVHQVDKAQFSTVYPLNPSDSGEALASQFYDALCKHGQACGQFTPVANDGDPLEALVEQYSAHFRDLICGVYGQTWVEIWSTRFGSPSRVKMLKPRDASTVIREPNQISAEELKLAVENIERLLPEVYTPTFSTIPPNDPRYAQNKELGELLRSLANATGAVTKFTSHATEGIIGLFPPDKSFEPTQKAYFLKVFRSLQEVEAVFRNYPELKRRGIKVEHEPLIVADVGDGTYAVLSSSRILTMIGDIADILKREYPQVAERFVHEKMTSGIDRLVECKDAIGLKPSETEIARILHDYKLNLLTAWEDLHLASSSSKKNSRAMRHLYLNALELLDFKLDCWPGFLFGSVMDWKVYNDGQVTGLLNPTAEQLIPFLGSENGSLLEYAARPGVVFEDFFHVADSPQFALSAQKELDYYKRLLSRLLARKLDQELGDEQQSSLWHAFFTMKTFKSTRKAQRTLHYMASGNPEPYLTDLAHYQHRMVGDPWAAFMFFSDPVNCSSDFKKQIALVRQLCEAEDQWHKLNGAPSNPTLERWADWYFSNRYLASLEIKPESLGEFVVVR